MIENKSVLLKYSNRNRRKFQKHAEFLRFVGVFVCEYLVEDEDSINLDGYDYDVECELDSGIKLKEYCSYWFEGSVRTYDQLKRVFEKFDLLQASVTLQYFSMNTGYVQKAGHCFKEASEELDAYFRNISRAKDEYEFQYARLYCKQKANLAQYLTNKELYFPIDELGKECVILQKQFPDCPNTFMLLGMIYEISKGNKMDAIDAFTDAKNGIGDMPYVSSVLYRLGKVCEGSEVLRWLMNDSYLMSYKAMPKYRTIYKLARMHMNQGQWDLAINYFNECLAKIKIKKNFLDPLEQEYYFKVHSHLAYISIKRRDYVSAIEYAEEALEFRENIEFDNMHFTNIDRFYKEIYEHKGKKTYIMWNASELVDVELERMSLSNIYLYLATAYQELGADDIADIYWNHVRI